jgi:hypothetical protein
MDAIWCEPELMVIVAGFVCKLLARLRSQWNHLVWLTEPHTHNMVIFEEADATILTDAGIKIQAPRWIARIHIKRPNAIDSPDIGGKGTQVLARSSDGDEVGG